MDYPSLWGILIAASVAAWVYSDATARRAPHALLWGIGTFLLLIVVLPAWLLTRPPRPDPTTPVHCQVCGSDNPPGTSTCQICGRDVR